MFFAYEALLWLAFLAGLPWFLLAGLSRGKYLGSFRERLGRYGDGSIPHDLWIQAVSVGEVMVAQILVREIRRLRPDTSIILTTTTATGRTMADRTMPDCDRAFFPFDFSPAVRNFLDRHRPSMYVTVETEIWPNVTRMCRERGIPVLLTNGRISDRSFSRYLRLRFFIRRILELYQLFLVREGIDRERLIAMGAPEERVEAVGNVKFDLHLGHQPLEFATELEAMRGEKPTVVLGSLVESEDELVIPKLGELVRSGAFIIVAPRKPARFDAVAALLTASGVSFARRTELDSRPEQVDVLLLDSIGELARVYREASVCFVGGSLVDTGGHNPIEPAAAGAPVLFGPYMSNFREIASVFLLEDAAIEVRTVDELVAKVQQLLEDDTLRAAHASRSRAVVDRNRGAASQTARRIVELLH